MQFIALAGIPRKTGVGWRVAPEIRSRMVYAISLNIRRLLKNRLSKNSGNLRKSRFVNLMVVRYYYDGMPRDLMILDDPSKNDRRFDGKAMALLNDRQRLFVLEMLQRGTAKKACVGAAKAAGYNPEYGWELLRDDGVLAAMREETTKRLSGAALIGVNVIIDIARNGKHKDQLKAAIKLAELTGYTAEQKIVVEHIDRDTRAQVNKIIVLAGNLGVDPKKLLIGAGISTDVIDGEFTEVEDG